ncbi:MAG: hypothetical protein ACOY71_08670 [Gemmatimonadota bacterium]
MADPCGPISPCTDLDGRLLLRRSVYGPQLAFDPGAVSLEGLPLQGAALRAVLDLRFEVRWRSTGLCYGPPTSVMGLAPGEVVTIGLRTRSVRTFSSLMRDAAEKSRSSSHTERETGPAPPSFSAGPFGAIAGLAAAIANTAGEASGGRFIDRVADQVAGTVGAVGQGLAGAAGLVSDKVDDAIDLLPIFVGKFGSIFGDAIGALGAGVGAVAGAVGGVVGAVAGIPGAAANAVGDLVDNVVGGAVGRRHGGHGAAHRGDC